MESWKKALVWDYALLATSTAVALFASLLLQPLAGAGWSQVWLILAVAGYVITVGAAWLEVRGWEPVPRRLVYLEEHRITSTKSGRLENRQRGLRPVEEKRPAGSWRPLERGRWSAGPDGGGQLPEGVSLYQRRAPARDPSPAADVVVPGLQALITGVAVALLALILGASGRVSLALGIIALLALWIALLQGNRALLWLEELVEGQEPEPPAQPVTHMAITVGQAQHRAELPADLGALQAVARRLLLPDTRPSRRELVGRGLLPSREAWIRVRDFWLRAGWIEWVNPEAHQAGLQLTQAGREGMEKLVRGDIESE